jgi:hypothetical protein
MCDPTGGIATTAILAAASTGANYMASQQQQSAMRSAQNAADQRMAGIITRDSMANFNAAQQEAARNRQLLDAENERQKQFSQQTQAVQNESIRRNSADSMNQLLANETAQGEQRYAPAANIAAESAMPIASAGGNASDTTRVVADSMKNQLSKASEYLKGLGNARAGMDAFGNTMLDQNIAMQRSNGQIGKIGSMADISRNAFNSEYGASNNMSNLAYANIGRNTGYDTQAANVAAQSGYNNAQAAGQNMQTLGSLLGSASQIAGMYGSANGWQNPTLAKNRALLANASANTQTIPGYQPQSIASRPVIIR